MVVEWTVKSIQIYSSDGGLKIRSELIKRWKSMQMCYLSGKKIWKFKKLEAQLLFLIFVKKSRVVNVQQCSSLYGLLIRIKWKMMDGW